MGQKTDNKVMKQMKGKINEIGDTENGMYAIGQVAGRAYDRMLNSPRNKKSEGIVALDPKYGKVAQDAAYAGAGGYMQWRKKFKEKNRREPSYEEYRAWMQNYDNGVNDYGKPESERKGVVKLSESQLKKIVAESVKKVLNEGVFGDEPFYRNEFGEKTTTPQKREGPSYIESAIDNIEMVQDILSNLTEHIQSLPDSNEKYAFGYWNESSKTIDVLRKIYPLVQEICKIWDYQHKSE